VEAIAGDPQRLRRMREGAQRVAAEQLDWNRLIERTLEPCRARPR
jgi:glycosyltransferase involved in cell wall biosynthesis